MPHSCLDLKTKLVLVACCGPWEKPHWCVMLGNYELSFKWIIINWLLSLGHPRKQHHHVRSLVKHQNHSSSVEEFRKSQVIHIVIWNFLLSKLLWYSGKKPYKHHCTSASTFVNTNGITKVEQHSCLCETVLLFNTMSSWFILVV